MPQPVRLETIDHHDAMDDTADAVKVILQAATVAIGKLAANSGVDIGDVTLNAGTAEFGKLAAGSARIGIVLEDRLEVRLAKAIDAADGAYAANDVVSDDNCSTTSTAWEFLNMANANGGYGIVDFATIFSESENIEPRLTLILFNALPTGVTTDNVAYTLPPADKTKWVGEIAWAALNKMSASIASTSQASPSTVGMIPLTYKCASGTTSLFAILVTLDAFTQTATDDIEITLQIRHL